MNSSYTRKFYSALGRSPLMHSARVAALQLRRNLPDHRRAEATYHDVLRAGSGVAPAGPELRPPSHTYQNYAGPWLEDFFFRFWLERRPATRVRYVPVFWNILYQHIQTQRFTPRVAGRIHAAIRRLLDETACGNGTFFTITDYDHPLWDWHDFPRNIAVFSGGGWGDVPLPLLKGSPPFTSPPKDIHLSFVGKLDGHSDATGVRGRMHAALRTHALFTQGPDWRSIMERSVFSLCPRGLGRASFRLYEALSVGSIPIYIWDDIEWLPYRDRLDWSEFSLSVHIDEVDQIPARLAALSPGRIASMQERVADLYTEWFSLEGCCRRIVEMAGQLEDPVLFKRLMQQRPYPPGTIPTRPVPDFSHP